MTPFIRLDGKAAPLNMANVDTDQIIPKQFLKTVERKGLGKGLLYDFRYDYGYWIYRSDRSQCRQKHCYWDCYWWRYQSKREWGRECSKWNFKALQC